MSHDAAVVDEPVIRGLQLGDLPSIDAETAAALRLLQDPRLADWLTEIYGVAVRACAAPAVATPLLRIALSCAGSTLVLGVPSRILPSLALAVSNGSDVQRSIAPLIAARLLSPLLQQFVQAAAVAGDPRWNGMCVTDVETQVTSDLPTGTKPLAFWQVAHADQVHGDISIVSIGGGCIAALQEIVGRKSVRQPLSASAWRVGSMLRFATRKWSTSLLRSLERGDVLLCNEGTTTEKLAATMYCGALSGRHWTAGVEINHNEVRLMTQIQTHEGRNGSDPEQPGPLLSSSVAELEVPVHFELDNAALSLAQLSALRPGYVIELSIPVDDAEIRLVSCGQIIARGKLVVIGDCLGVQIEHLASGGA